MKKWKVREAVIVEGKYDQIKLSSFIDGLILTTNGFGIFRDQEKMKLLRRLADERGLLVLTDSDAAGFQIRNYLKSSIDPAKIKHAYIPDIYGKERRKREAGKEGKVGVEGVPVEILRRCLQQAGVNGVDVEQSERPITKTDFFFWGLSGRADSVSRRLAVKRALHLPEHLSTTALLGVLNTLITRDALEKLCESLFSVTP